MKGLWRVKPDSGGQLQLEKATLQSGLFSDSVQSLLEDREGNVWVGTTVGLHRLTPQKMTPVTNIGLVNAAEARGDEFWVAHQLRRRAAVADRVAANGAAGRDQRPLCSGDAA